GQFCIGANIYEAEAVFDEMSRTEWNAVREETLAYVDELREAGVLLDAQPLRSATSATTLKVRDGRLSFTDGPFTESKEQLGGYFLIDVPDLDAAIRIAAKWPGARFGEIELRPVEETLRPEGRYR
ncbi:YciI family protein, partial [Algiphilus sp.]|uniref:YciI family protein n=1 Tax=Algiphilus sp. TaxID=1872431 RepID=UPI0025C25CAF